MSISAFIFFYTLRTNCDGNKADLARRIGVMSKDIYQYEKQFLKGGGSAVGMDALLEMYLSEGLSVDAVMDLYNDKDLPVNLVKCPNIDVINAMRKEFAEEMEANETARRYQKSVDAFLSTQIRLFCGTRRKVGSCRVFKRWVRNGRPEDKDWADCPCMHIMKCARAEAEQLTGK